MKVLTKYGVGRTENRIAKSDLEVKLEYPHEGESKKTMRPNEMFPFTTNGAIRILHMREIGNVSSLCFIDPVQVDSLMESWHLPSNETTLLFDLFTGIFKTKNYNHNENGKPFLFLQPHVNRWAREVPRTFSTYEEATGYTQRARGIVAGIGDISTSILFDVPKHKILWIFITTRPSRGHELVAFEKKFV